MRHEILCKSNAWRDGGGEELDVQPQRMRSGQVTVTIAQPRSVSPGSDPEPTFDRTGGVGFAANSI